MSRSYDLVHDQIDDDDDEVTPEMEADAGDILARLRAGTFYDDVPASGMANPNDHPRGPDYVPDGYWAD